MWITDISELMYNKCKIDDKKENLNFNLEDRLIYHYCKNIKNKPELYNIWKLQWRKRYKILFG